MERDAHRRLTSGEIEMVLRRAAELGARRRDGTPGPMVSPEVLVRVAAAVGIPEGDVRRAMSDLSSEEAAEPRSLPWRLYGPARLRTVREVGWPAGTTRDQLERLLRHGQGLKLRRRTEAGSTWDAGDLLGVVRRTLDFSGERALLKAGSVELRVENTGDGRCEANLTADVSNQRGDHLSLAGILGATLALPAAIAGVQEPLFFLGILPALAAPGLGFKLAYRRACAGIRHALDGVLDAAEEGPPRVQPQRGAPIERVGRPPGRIRSLKPIPRFMPQQHREE